MQYAPNCINFVNISKFIFIADSGQVVVIILPVIVGILLLSIIICIVAVAGYYWMRCVCCVICARSIILWQCFFMHNSEVIESRIDNSHTYIVLVLCKFFRKVSSSKKDPKVMVRNKFVLWSLFSVCHSEPAKII